MRRQNNPKLIPSGEAMARAQIQGSPVDAVLQMESCNADVSQMCLRAVQK